MAQLRLSRRYLSALWRFFSSMKLAVVLLILFILGSLIGTLFPQVTPDISEDPTAYAQWWTLARDKYGLLAGFYQTLNLFDVYRSLWFWVLLAALILNIGVCTLNRFNSLWKAATASPKVKLSEAFYERMPIQATLTFAPSEGMGEALSALLSRHRYRVWTESEGETTYLCAHRNRTARLGTLATHAGLVLIVAGALWGGLYGWREDKVTLGSGQVYSLGHGRGFQVRCQGFEVVRYPDGRPRDYLSYLTVLEEGREVLRKTVRVNDPLTYQGVSFYLSSYGPAVRVHGVDEAGEPLPLRLGEAEEEAQGEVVLTFSGREEEGNVLVPSRDMALHVAFSSHKTSEEEPLLYLEVSEEKGGPTRIGFVRSGQTVELDGMRFDFTLDHYTVLQVVRDPGFIPVMAASFLIMIGLILAFYFPRRRIWARVVADDGSGQGKVSLAGRAERDAVGFENEFKSLVEEVKEELEAIGVGGLEIPL